MKVAGIHHISLRSQDPGAARDFWERVVGFGFMEVPVSGASTVIWKGGPAEGVLFATQVGSSLFIISPPLEGTAEDDRFSEYRIGVDHIAFAVEDREELDGLVERLRAAGVETEGVETDPVLGKEYVAFRDPDNVQCEAYMVQAGTPDVGDLICASEPQLADLLIDCEEDHACGRCSWV